MPRYRVTLEGPLIDVWEVEAESPEKADEKIRQGKGRWIDQRWAEDPETKDIDEVDLG